MKLAFVPATVLVSLAILAGCAGHSDLLDSDSGCIEVACSAGETWDPAACACSASPDGGGPEDVITTTSDDATVCPPIACPAGWIAGVIVGGECACVPVDAGLDATTPVDAPATDDAPVYTYDAPIYNYDAPYYADAPIYSYDAPYSYEDGCSTACEYPSVPGPDCTCVCEYIYDCPPGYAITSQCTCELCPANSCPSGQTPGASCGSCVACADTCPAGFSFGSECDCVPDGLDAGPPDAGHDAGDDAGPVVCNIGGYYGTCTAGEWCELGVCPESTVQYGCYCNADGTATCNINCPPPPPCEIPGLGTCPYNTSCTYGSCAGDSASELQCYCEGQNQAYCETVSCDESEGGTYATDSSLPP